MITCATNCLLAKKGFNWCLSGIASGVLGSSFGGVGCLAASLTTSAMSRILRAIICDDYHYASVSR
jgi:hypothetical protein